MADPSALLAAVLTPSSGGALVGEGGETGAVLEFLFSAEFRPELALPLYRIINVAERIRLRKLIEER